MPKTTKKSKKQKRVSSSSKKKASSKAESKEKVVKVKAKAETKMTTKKAVKAKTKTTTKKAVKAKTKTTTKKAVKAKTKATTKKAVKAKTKTTTKKAVKAKTKKVSSLKKRSKRAVTPIRGKSENIEVKQRLHRLYIGGTIFAVMMMMVGSSVAERYTNDAGQSSADERPVIEEVILAASVEIEDFSVSYLPGSIDAKITWKTMEENGVDRFRVYASPSPHFIEASPIKTVTALGARSYVLPIRPGEYQFFWMEALDEKNSVIDTHGAVVLTR